jgi:hypothetical protein
VSSSLSNPTIHQAGVTIPKLDAPFVDPNGNITPWWFRVLNVLWTRTGGATPLPYSAYIAENPSTGNLTLYQGQQATEIGPVQTGTQAGAPPQVQSPSSSPWVFTATGSGTLVVAGGQVNIKRSTAVWHPIGLQGGCIPLLNGDQVQVIWYGASPPPVVWLPTVEVSG